MESTWLDHEITVDGSVAEWEKLPVVYVDEWQGVAGVANDTASVFVMLRVGNQQLARRLRFGGLTLWLDPKGGKQRKLGICTGAARHAGHGKKRLGNRPK
ncbi:MAG: hypothetical protein QHJ34_10450 [bacterium]|nr:hypothetical protein [candidate division KSB1 bacterium]MDH7560635.1 hypothetical protein [bacterium]